VTQPFPATGFPAAADKNDNECRQNTPFGALRLSCMKANVIILSKKLPTCRAGAG
jgi:hypothetical protein